MVRLATLQKVGEAHDETMAKAMWSLSCPSGSSLLWNKDDPGAQSKVHSGVKQ